MVDFTQIISELRATRQELLEQLRAVDNAITALETPHPIHVEQPTHGELDEAPAEAVPPAVDQPVVPTILKPKRTLADSHKEALVTGRRKARVAKEVAAGLAREIPDDTFVPALSAGVGNEAPRLVKKPRL